MSSNMFSAAASERAAPVEERQERTTLTVPDYSVSPSELPDHIVAFLIGFAAGFAILFIFYKIVPLSVAGGVALGIVNIFASARNAIVKRRSRLRVQFYDMLEAMSVAMRAGNPVLKALESARADLTLIYGEDSDIIVETDILLARFNNAIPLSEAFSDFAERSELEDVASFASVYATIEGKSSRANEIVRETQQIIGDKMEIEMEIETLMTAAKSEGYIMLVMPLIILLIIGYAGAGFMDAIYTEALGRVVATGGLIVFFISYFLIKKFSRIKV